jgi:L-lactate utilization protein LutB
MDTSEYWQIRLNELRKALEKNNFEAYVAENSSEANNLVTRTVIPETGAKTVLRGDSMTCIEAGVFEALTELPGISYIDPWVDGVPFEERSEFLRHNLAVDLMVTGTNAVTETGQLVNLDMVGNRVGGITFGPKHVIVLVGRNKIVPDLGSAMERTRNYAAPANAMRFGLQTPCAKTARCSDCSSPDRICNTWSILEKSYPKGRVKVVLINEDLGL